MDSAERMKSLGTRLKNSLVFKRERIGWQEVPLRVRSDDPCRVVVVGLVVGAEEESAPLPCPGGDFTEELRFKQPVLVMALLRPGIGEQQIDLEQLDAGRQRVKKGPGFTADEMKIGKARPVALAQRFFNPFKTKVDADAKPVRMGRGVGGEKMPVATADFQNQPRQG